MTNQQHEESIIREQLARGDWAGVFDALTKNVPKERLTLLWDICMEADLNDLEQMEEKIYSYGESLGSKDVFGRKIFIRMVTALRNAQNAIM